MAKQKLKILYTEEGYLLYSKFWPEVPAVQASANAEAIQYNTYQRKLADAIRQAVHVFNRDRCFLEIIWQVGELHRDEFYEIEVETKFTDGKLEIVN